MASLPSKESLRRFAAAGLELASNPPSGKNANIQSTTSDPSASKVPIVNPRNAKTRGQPTHWSTHEKVQLWKAYEDYGGDIHQVHECFSKMRSGMEPYRSMDSLSKKLCELLAQRKAIRKIDQMAGSLYWSKTNHRIEGTDAAEVRALLRKLKSDAPNKDSATNRSYADYFCNSKKLEWFSICCGEQHNPGNERAPAPPTMPQKSGPGGPQNNYSPQLRTPPSMAPRPTDNSSQGGYLFTPTTKFASRSEAATAGRRPLAAYNMDEEFMVPRSPETEDETGHGRPAHYNTANSPSVASSYNLPASSAARIITLAYPIQSLASRVPTAASAQSPSPPPVPAPVPIASNQSPRAEDPARINSTPAHNSHSFQYARPQPPASSNYQKPRVDSPVQSDEPDQTSPDLGRPAKRKRCPSIKSERGASPSYQIIDISDDSDGADFESTSTTDNSIQIVKQIEADINRLGDLTIAGKTEMYNCFADDETGKYYLAMLKLKIAKEVRLQHVRDTLERSYLNKGKDKKALFRVPRRDV